MNKQRNPFSPHELYEGLYSRRKAAVYLGLAEGTLAVWASTGRYELPYVKIGSRAMYRRSDLDAFIERRTRTHTD